MFFLSCNGELLPILVLVDRLLKKFSISCQPWLVTRATEPAEGPR